MLPGLANTQEEVITQEPEYQQAGITGDHLREASHTYALLFVVVEQLFKSLYVSVILEFFFF